MLVFATAIVHAGCTMIALRSLAIFESGRKRLKSHTSGAILSVAEPYQRAVAM